MRLSGLLENGECYEMRNEEKTKHSKKRDGESDLEQVMLFF